MKVIVFSCDRYSWLMPTFLHFYRKNWPDNPYETELVTETIKVKDVNTFCVGKLPWADRAIKYLESFDEETFLLLLEDYIINETVNTSRMKVAESLCDGDIGCVQLNPHNRLSHFLLDTKIEGFKEYPLDKPYSVSLRSSIWQREFFLEVLKKGETAWQTEVNGSKRIQQDSKKVIWADTPIISYGGYMGKGVVLKSAEQWVKENW